MRHSRMPHRHTAVCGRHARAGQTRYDACPARVGRVGWRRLPSRQRPRRLLPRGGTVSSVPQRAFGCVRCEGAAAGRSSRSYEGHCTVRSAQYCTWHGKSLGCDCRNKSGNMSETILIADAIAATR